MWPGTSIQHVLEYLGGERDEPPACFSVTLSNSLFWAIWWLVLIEVIYVFSGQSSKFIYIDF
jgi:hypothetical protein